MYKFNCEWDIIKIGRLWYVIRDGKEEVRILPCKTMKEAGEALDKLLATIGER